MAIKLVPVAGSSNILAIGYDEISQTLRVAFHHGGVYDISGVSREIYNDFWESPSKGKFYAREIKGKYHSVQVLLSEKPPPPEV